MCVCVFHILSSVFVKFCFNLDYHGFLGYKCTKRVALLLESPFL